MSDSVDRVFVHALNTVKKIPRTGSARPPPADRLKLYGLYKQSMEGDVEGVMERPIGDGPEPHAEREKWDAWHARRHLSRTEAKRQYITTLIETMHRYATPNPEARELVSELEFVWDQIKSNSSSSSSSPMQAMEMPRPPLTQQTSYASLGRQMSRDYDGNGGPSAGGPGRDSRLRVLSPVSQADEEMGRRNSETDKDDEDDEDEEFQEARDGLYNDEEDELNNEDPPARKPPVDLQGRRWRRRVEQALTKMTTEVAAMREQMEARALYNRRRSGALSWLRWLIWVAMRQIFWNLVVLGLALIWMRLKGDRRLEEKVRLGWTELRRGIGRGVGKIPLPRRLLRQPHLP